MLPPEKQLNNKIFPRNIQGFEQTIWSQMSGIVDKILKKKAVFVKGLVFFSMVFKLFSQNVLCMQERFKAVVLETNLYFFTPLLGKGPGNQEVTAHPIHKAMLTDWR